MFLPDYQSVTDDGVRSAFNEIWHSDSIAPEKA
jgi:formate dehydrogenase major subunit